jgi:hypothetical protein
MEFVMIDAIYWENCNDAQRDVDDEYSLVEPLVSKIRYLPQHFP